MPTSRTASRNATTARTEVLTELKNDHKRVKKAYRDFQKCDPTADQSEVEAIVQQVLDELTVHAAVEEELLYPAARGAISEENLVDEAEVEHESMHALIDQLRTMEPDDEKYAARFTVLCEYVLHHVKEEEGEMFPQLERARLDWESLAAEMKERREELMPAEMDGAEAQSDEGTASDDESETAVEGLSDDEGPIESGPTRSRGSSGGARRGGSGGA